MATGNITRLEGVWPETHERAVRDSAGVTLETKLGNINTNISQLDQEVNGEEAISVSISQATTAGTAISATPAKDLGVVLKAGKRYRITWTGLTSLVKKLTFYTRDSGDVSVPSYWNDGSTAAGSFGAQKSSFDFIPTGDVYKMRLYAGASDVVGTGTVEISIVNFPEEGLADEVAKLGNAVAVSIVEKGVRRNKVYIKFADGSIVSSGTYFDTFTFPNLGYKRIRVRVGLSDGISAAIAFYSGAPGLTTTYISGVQGQGGTYTYDAVVPAGCKSIMVTNRNSTLATPTIEVFANDESQAIERSVNYRNPFKNQPYYFHYNPEGFIVDGANVKVYPGESLAAVRMAARLGFQFIEANVHKTSDGEYVVLHGESGAFGGALYSLDSTDISDVQISSVALSYIKENVRYKDVPAKYGEVPTLGEFVAACKSHDIGLFVGSGDADAIGICMNHLGQDNVIVYGHGAWGRSFFKGVMYAWNNSSEITKEELLTQARTYGRPFISGIGPATLAALIGNNTMDAFVAEMHAEGFLVGIASVYQTEGQARDAFSRGVDISGAGHEVNPFQPNYEVYDLDGDASQFGGTGTISGGIATLATGQYMECGTADSIELGKGLLSLRFSGAITVNFGSAGSRSISSDGEEDIVISDYFLREGTKLYITATAATTINVLVYKTSRC